MMVESERGCGAVSECCIGSDDWLIESPAKDMEEGESKGTLSRECAWSKDVWCK